jgi:hypothetical protein
MAPVESHVNLADAERMADGVAQGRPLPTLVSPVPLADGEVLHAQIDAQGWRFRGVDVVYEQRRAVAAGIVTFGVATALASIGNRRARRRAEELAVPQWRPLGMMPVLATNQRLLVFHERVWQSVWYSGICQLIPSPADGYLELRFEADPPYLLSGEWVPYLTVVVTTVLAQTYGVDAVAAMLQAG